MEEFGLEQIVRQGAMKLSESLYAYYPNEDGYEIPERNMTVHLASSFLNNGFNVYAEAHSKDDVTKRIDFMALSSMHKIQVAVEAKCLFNSEKMEEIKKDAGRVSDFKIAPDRSYIKTDKKYGVIIATTWKDDIVQWWSSLDGDYPSGNEVWKQVEDMEILKVKNARWGSVVLQGYNVDMPKSTNFHYFLYCIFRV